MAKIPFMLSGAGDGSDDCTATATDVLEGKTAIYNGSDDDAVAGTMKDYSGTSTQATGSMNSSNSRVQMAIPNTGKYDTAANLYVPYSTMRTLIGYTDASKVLTGTTICGLAGTMADKSGSSTSVTPTLSNSQMRMTITSNGYYNTSAYLYSSYSNVASVIGLTAAKIKYGETILGITGTWNGYVATSSDLYYGGSVGSLCGSMSTYTANGATISSGSSCVTCDMTGMSGANAYAAVGFSTALNCGAYSKITLTFNVTKASSSNYSTVGMGIAVYSSRPTSGSAFSPDNAMAYGFSTSVTSTGSGKTVTVDISGISSTLYVGAFARVGLNSSNYPFIAEITRIQVS